MQHASSIERQKELAEKECEAKGIRILAYFVDEAVSAYKGKNRSHQLGELVKLVEKGNPRPDYLVIEDVDRLSRESPLDFIANFSRLFQSGIKIIQTSRGLVTDPREGLDLIMMMLGQFRANDENVRRAKRISASYEQRFRAGVRRPKVPFGYEKSSNEPSAPLVPHPKHSKVVRRIFRLFSEGHSYNRIARTLNEEGVLHPGSIQRRDNKPAFGNGWTAQSVKTILLNDGYITGDQKTKYGVIHGVYNPPLIEKRMAERVRRIISALKHKRTYPERAAMGKPSNLFSDLLRCRSCGEKYVITQSKSWSYRRYGCKQHVIGLCENAFTIQVVAFEEIVLGTMLDFFRKGDLSGFLTKIEEARSDHLEGLRSRLVQSDVDLGKEQGRLDGLLDRYGEAPKDLRKTVEDAIRKKKKLLRTKARDRSDLRHEIEEKEAQEGVDRLREFADEIFYWINGSTSKKRLVGSSKVVRPEVGVRIMMQNSDPMAKAEYLEYRLKLKSLMNEIIGRVLIEPGGIAWIELRDNHLLQVWLGCKRSFSIGRLVSGSTS